MEMLFLYTCIKKTCERFTNYFPSCGWHFGVLARVICGSRWNCQLFWQNLKCLIFFYKKWNCTLSEHFQSYLLSFLNQFQLVSANWNIGLIFGKYYSKILICRCPTSRGRVTRNDVVINIVILWSDPPIL